MKNRKLLSFCSLILFVLSVQQTTFAQDNSWTHFRGSALNSISSAEKVPLIWNDHAAKWKTEIHGRGYSSPVILNNQVWVTTGTPDGKELYAVCLDYETGKIIHDVKVFTPSDVVGKHSINTYASPSPCIEEGFVYVHYGSLGTACLKTSDGSVVWTRTDLKCNHVQGPGSSPLIYKNLLILHFDGIDVRYLIALDKATGKTVWRTDRPLKPFDTMSEIGKKAYVTPIIINVKGRDQLISNGSAVCSAYDPLTGEEIWQVVRGAESTVPMPFTENGIVYFYCGCMSDNGSRNFTEILAVNPDGSGDITNTNVIWRKREDQNHTQMLTPLIHDGLIYTINTKNIMMCIDAKTGKDVWTAQQSSEFNSSPVYADGNVWFFSVKGDVIAVNAGREYKVVATNKMESGIWATPAFVSNSVILRTEKYLYRLAM